MAEDRWDFFIAYASPDRRAAETLHDLLSTVFRVFLDRRSLLPGDDWARRLSAAQDGAAVTLVLISPRTDAAYYQREEIARALDLARREDAPHRVVPVLLDAPGDPVDLPHPQVHDHDVGRVGSPESRRSTDGHHHHRGNGGRHQRGSRWT